MRIRQINSPYHTNISKSITSSSIDTLLPLAGKVALATLILFWEAATMRGLTQRFVSNRSRIVSSHSAKIYISSPPDDILIFPGSYRNLLLKRKRVGVINFFAQSALLTTDTCAFVVKSVNP